MDLITKNGYAFDEVASALQKEIRRCKVKESLYWALELFESGYWHYVFNRLCVIAAEDIGKANFQLVSTVFSVANYVEKLKQPPDPVILSFVVVEMAKSPKSRENDEVVNLVMIERKEGQRLEVPEYAIDKHTKRGKAMGKTVEDFWKEVKLENDIGSDYHKDLYDKLFKDKEE